MSESLEQPSEFEDRPTANDAPVLDPLPPVTPPSAGFIVQLFLVPAVIVMAIVGVWALFGRMAASRHDVDDLVVELRSNNKHRRDRAMVSLAQMIEADRALGDEGEELAAQPKVAEAITTVFRERLAGEPEVDDIRIPDGERGEELRRRRASARERERLESLSMTARALGLFDAPAVVAPALLDGMTTSRELEVRKDCINSISVIANRASETENDELLTELVETPGLVDTLVELTFEQGTEDAELLRNTATYALGLLPTDASRDRLVVLAEHRNEETRFNAAIGLARQKSKAGLPVFVEVLEGASTLPEAAAGAPAGGPNLLLITLLAATFTSLIMAAANKGAIRYIGTGLSVALLIAAGVVVANDGDEKTASKSAGTTLTAAERDEQVIEHVLALHAVENSLRATEQLADELTDDERTRFEKLVEPIAESHPEARLRVDAARTLGALRRAG